MNTCSTVLIIILGVTFILTSIYLHQNPEQTKSLKESIYSQLKASDSKSTRDLSQYKKIHQKILNGELPLRVSFNCLNANGYGNRIYTMLTVFVMAVLGDRALLIPNWNMMPNFIEEPFNYSFHNFSNEQNGFNFNYKSNEIANFHVFDVTFIRFKKVELLTKVQIFNDSVERVCACGVDPHFFPICSNPIYYEKLWQLGLVERSTIDNAFEKLNDTYNMVYTPDMKLESVLRVGYEVAGNMLNKYWIPKPRMQKLIDHYVKKHFKNRYVIGLQMREPYMDMWKNLGIKNFIECAEHIEQEIKADQPDIEIKWFLTADSQRLYDLVHAEYPNKLIVVNGTIGHVGETSLELWERVYERTILDNELLSRCDEMIITGGSTYGFVAAIKSMRLPYSISGSEKCKRASLSNPPFYAGTASFK